MEGFLISKFKFDLHSAAITSISTAVSNLSIFVTGSRDHTILVWEINNQTDMPIIPKKRLRGHSNFVSELALSFDGQFCISSSWDKTLNLWDIETGKILKTFVGHKKDVLSVSFSTDNRQIVSSSRDYSIKIWNTVGQCKDTFIDKDSTSWISCVKFIPNKNSNVLSCGWDGIVKIWNVVEKKVQMRLNGHKGYLSSLCISPDGSLCASGGKDSTIMLWDLQEGKHLYSLNTDNPINCMCFSPNRYWLCAGTSKGIKIWDLESKTIIEKLKVGISNSENSKNKVNCTAINWTIDGNLFLSGFIDGQLKIWTHDV
nr:guanine nucleotide-binding protein beta SU like protein [Cryptomonas curvata]